MKQTLVRIVSYTLVFLSFLSSLSFPGGEVPKTSLKATATTSINTSVPKGGTSTSTGTPTSTKTSTATFTPTSTFTLTPTLEDTITPTSTMEMPMPTDTLEVPTAVETSTPSELIAPYPSAPLCPDSGANHDRFKFHTLWDAVRGCHYDHEHGQNPFTPEVANAFPEFNLYQLLGNVEIGSTNPSSPMENTMKHGGFKWQVDLNVPHGCTLGFEDGTVAIDKYAIEVHGFGDYSMEMEARNHSSVALLEQCKESNPEDKGYIFVVQLQEYGQRVSPYQNFVIPYPNSPDPAYDSPSGPYFTVDCIGVLTGCRANLDFIRSRDLNTNSIWTSKPTGMGQRPDTSKLLRVLFRVRDTYQVFDSSDLTYPFTFPFICGGATYNPVGCRYNNSTLTVDEVAGDIPVSWDNLEGFDTDPRTGRISGEFFVTRYGDINFMCDAPGTQDCYPIKLVHAFVGKYSSELSAAKVSNPTPQDTPEKDIYFCGTTVCSETDANSRPSGWIGANN